MSLTQEEKDDAIWPDEKETLFFTVLYERVKKDPTGNPTFKSRDWNDMDSEMLVRGHYQYGSDRLRGKYNKMKLIHRQFGQLLAHTGVTYDSSRNVVHATEEVWQKFNKMNKGFRTLKRKGCKNYLLMNLVFGKGSASGGLATPSTQVPTHSDEERRNEDIFLHGEGGMSSERSHSKGKRKAEEAMGSSNKDWKSVLANAVHTYTTTMSEKEKRRRSRDEDVSTTSTGAAGNFSMTRCVEVINAMPNVSTRAYNDSIDALTDVVRREAFMAMPADRQLDWVMRFDSN
ncbi:unnamed protein product [Cuscuta epithymum]|uniref:Myb/SANT-like domain-containing protein n=1 Tax=Cuscuta epithymum TaxID=186058 RepID=A0AAV0BXB9_9ASTE|nr:unnamed protein product [Cuscuta epithymum]